MPDAPAFTLRQLSYFLAAAEHGTFAAAAREVHLSASAFADAMTELEKAVGVQLLFRRRAHGLTLTAHGADLLPRARRLLTDAAEIGHALTAEPGRLVGPVRVGCYVTLGPAVVPALLTDVRAHHPGIEVTVVEVSEDDVTARLVGGELDLAIVYATPPASPGTAGRDGPDDGALVRERLRHERAHVLVAADDPLAERATVTLEDLAARDLVLFDVPPSSTNTLSMFASRGLTPRIVHRTASVEVVRTLVGRGLGYAVLVRRTANPASPEGRPLLAREIDPAPEPVGIDVVWPAGAALTPRARSVVDVVRATTGEDDHP